jgi:hypothetical protein
MSIATVWLSELLEIDRLKDTAHINIINFCPLHSPVAVHGDESGSRLKGNRPMHEKEVDIAQIQVLQGSIQGWLNIL